MAEKGRFQIPKSFASANSVTRPDRSSILAAAGSVVNTFPRLAPAITDQSEQCRPGVMEGQPVTNAKVGRTSGLPVRASSGCLSHAASEPGGFATGRPEVCSTNRQGEDRDGRRVRGRCG